MALTGTVWLNSCRRARNLASTMAAVKGLAAQAWPMLRAAVFWKHWPLALAVIGISVFMGMAVAVLELQALFITAGLLLSLFILIDYRIGAVLLIILIPLSASSFFPHSLLGIKGLNPINLILLATLLSYFAKRMFHPDGVRLVPRELLWLYFLPVTIAAIIGSTHVGEIPPVLTETGDMGFDSASGYLRDMFIKPMLLVGTAILLGAAVRDMKHPQRVLVPILLSIWVLCLLVIIFFAVSGMSLAELANPYARTFLSPLGMHANDLGRLYATTYAIVLFLLGSATRFFGRLVLLATLALIAIALVFTFSRAAFLAFALINIAFFLSRRNFRILLLGAVLGVMLIVLLPGAVSERLSLGFEGKANVDEISAGRTDLIWEPLLPEVLKSPFVGRGLGSTMWSDAMRAGTMLPVGHPHNAYLKAILDMGIIGLILLLAFYRWVLRGFQTLAGDAGQPPVFRQFFRGATVALVAFLLVGMSGSSLDPAPEQSYLWLAIGLAIGLASRTAQPEQTPCAA